MSTGWRAVLNGVGLSGGDPGPEDVGWLTDPPDGLGLPDLRTEDVTYPQRDGVRMFADWYSNRIITLTAVVCANGCPGCGSTREAVRRVISAWSRTCDETELVLHSDCEGQDPDRSLVGPWGAVGRPRQAQVVWDQAGCANLTLRFDCLDQRLFVLDEDGTPGSGTECVTLDTQSSVLTSTCRTYDLCYVDQTTRVLTGRCYDTVTAGSGVGRANVVDVLGDACAYPTIRLHGYLPKPYLENLTTDQRLNYTTDVAEGELVTIDTYTGTADGNRTQYLGGDTRFILQPGLNEIRLGTAATSVTLDGYAEVCWRPAVTWA